MPRHHANGCQTAKRAAQLKNDALTKGLGILLVTNLPFLRV